VFSDARRSGARLLALALVLSLVPLSAPAGSSSANETLEEPPNILLIVTDDQREGMGIMPQTEAIFRSGGTFFPNAFITTPLCCPSRASIFSGQFAHNHGVTKNGWVGGAEKFNPIGALPDLLQRAGYRTGVIGKYLNAWPVEETPPFFDEFHLTSGSTYYNGDWNRNGIMEKNPGYSTHVMTESARGFIVAQAASEQPWFLQVATVAPHRPFTPETRYANADVGPFSPTLAHAAGASAGKPGFIRRADTPMVVSASVRARQLRTLMSVDDMVAEIFSVLELTGEADNTLAIFLSDNGMMWGEFGVMNKGLPYTPSVKVPMLMRWPARMEGGRVDGRLVANIDIAPTVIEATGAPRPGHRFDGRSLLDPEWKRRHILLEYWGNVDKTRPWGSLRTKSWQYIEYYSQKDGERYHRELYDIRWDPHQVRNLLWKRKPPAKPNVNRVAKLLNQYRKCRGTTGIRACP
jgi:arylsulfatase A-like enzyme